MTTIIKGSYSEETIAKLLEKLTVRKKKFSARKYLGIIKLDTNPVREQKKLRDEWK